MMKKISQRTGASMEDMDIGMSPGRARSRRETTARGTRPRRRRAKRSAAGGTTIVDRRRTSSTRSSLTMGRIRTPRKKSATPRDATRRVEAAAPLRSFRTRCSHGRSRRARSARTTSRSGRPSPPPPPWRPRHSPEKRGAMPALPTTTTTMRTMRWIGRMGMKWRKPMPRRRRNRRIVPPEHLHPPPGRSALRNSERVRTIPMTSTGRMAKTSRNKSSLPGWRGARKERAGESQTKPRRVKKGIVPMRLIPMTMTWIGKTAKTKRLGGMRRGLPG
mmetsp:Transcript_41322/g.125053  ORF Transcript_41322/g.125053 Transcript_41322/m.125053 type:complete len:275 (+) Transcript_41322:123-947(+)